MTVAGASMVLSGASCVSRMDEFALHKWHRYATVVVDPIGRHVLWIGKGDSREIARAFFEQLPMKVIRRRAYGYRDEEYLFLNICAAFPVFLVDQRNGHRRSYRNQRLAMAA